MGYFDNIKKTGISAENTQERTRLRNVGRLIDDVRNCMVVYDGMKVGSFGETIYCNPTVMRELPSVNWYNRQFGAGIGLLVDDTEIFYCSNRKTQNPYDRNELSVRLPKSEYTETAGTDILFGFDGIDTVKKIYKELTDHTQPHESIYDIPRYKCRAEIRQDKIQIYMQYLIIIDDNDYRFGDRTPLTTLEKYAWGWDDESLTNAVHDIMLENGNPEPYMTRHDKISMRKLLTNRVIENKNDPGCRTFKESKLALNNLIETNFSKQPIYEHTGVQIPVKCNTEVLIQDRLLTVANKIINRLPNMFDGQPLEKNIMTI